MSTLQGGEGERSPPSLLATSLTADKCEIQTLISRGSREGCHCYNLNLHMFLRQLNMENLNLIIFLIHEA